MAKYPQHGFLCPIGLAKIDPPISIKFKTEWKCQFYPCIHRIERRSETCRKDNFLPGRNGLVYCACRRDDLDIASRNSRGIFRGHLQVDNPCIYPCSLLDVDISGNAADKIEIIAVGGVAAEGARNLQMLLCSDTETPYERIGSSVNELYPAGSVSVVWPLRLYWHPRDLIRRNDFNI